MTTIPLSTLLSHALVAWTIELDNEFETRMPHCTTVGIKAGRPIEGPWLVSFAMYVHCMRHLPPEGITHAELVRRARVLGPVSGMTRWGYVTVTPAASHGRRKPEASLAVVRPTAAGTAAQNYWRPLADEIDERWQERFGARAIKTLRKPLVAIASQIDPLFPDYLPLVSYGRGMMNFLPGDEGVPRQHQPPPLVLDPDAPKPSALPLYALLSRVLLAFAREYESESELPHAIGANFLRVLDDTGVPVAELPARAGISKDAVTNSLNLQKHGYLITEPMPGKRTKQARLTEAGLWAQAEYHRLVGEIEKRWTKQFGPSVVADLRAALEAIVVSDRLSESPLAAGLEPPADGWRGDVTPPHTLPHLPLVLRRGGYPDGA